MLSPDQLRIELVAIREREYEKTAEQDAFLLINQILDHLGSPDPVLRDELGYRVLVRWIYLQNLLTPDQLRHVLQRVLGEDGLFRQIGETDTDSVFWRSFSSLVIALIVALDKQTPFLQEEEFRKVLGQLVQYCQLEQDVRGYVPESGWAHAAAHVADALDECVYSRYASASDCLEVWKGIRSLVLVSGGVYGSEEDERMANPLTAMVERGLVPLPTLIQWLSELPQDDRGVEAMVRRINAKHLLRALYFRLRKADLLGESEAELLACLERYTL